ncbi:MAG TPA: tetratricopeptide repeat protein [Acidobacteriaceae bacterium]|nr:tetratricopeptide repeat protein [Acidobacteriaceae bacterium]
MMLRRILWLGLLATSSAWARDNGSGWIEVRSPHFTVVTNAGEGRGRHVAGQFERMRWVFQSTLPGGNLDPASPIVVIAVKDRKDMQALEPAAYLARGQVDLGGLFSRATDRNYILVRLDVEGEHPYSFVYHEYTHLMEGDAAEWMPLWLNEGLAEFFENTDVRDKEVLLGEPSTNDLQYLQHNPMIPLPVLFRVDATSPYYHEEQKGSTFYAESWALTHDLEVADFRDHANRIGRYLIAISKGVDPVTAAEQAFGDLQQLEAQLQDYVRAGRYTYFQKSTAELKLNEGDFAVTPLTVAQEDAIRADFLAYMSRPDDARALAKAALEADPNSAQAHEAMGRTEYAAGRHAEARKWYAEAAALDPESAVAQYFTGALAVMAGESDAEAESHLRAAIRLNPRFAPAYDALAALLAYQHDKLDQAHMLELQAIALDPGNLHYRLNTVHILMEQGKFDTAAQVLSAAKTLTRTPLEVDVVERMLRQVEQLKAQAEQEKQRQLVAEAQVAASTQAGAGSGAGIGGTAGQAGQIVLPTKPKHPTETPHGPDLWVEGTIREVHCTWPGAVELRVVGEKKSVTVYNNDASSIDYRALDFTPQEPIQPCRDLEGRHARVHYFATADKTVDGQITVIALWK